MIDTNILISALLFPGDRINELMHLLITKHQLILSSHVVEEFRNVTRRKFPDKVEISESLLEQLPYKFIFTSEKPPPGLFDIRDESDYPVLYSAVIEKVDVFITGDSDFKEVIVEKPEILLPSKFLDKYGLL